MKNLIGRSKTFLGLKNENNASTNAHDYEFAALFYIKNINVQLDNDLSEVLQIIKGLENLNKKSRFIFETNCSLDESLIWESVLENINNNLSQIDQQLFYLKGNIINKINLNGPMFWYQNQNMLNTITEEYQNLEKIAFQILPQVEKMYWRSAISEVQEETVAAIISHISICKQQFDFIALYTPLHKASAAMQDMVTSIPQNYNLDEAQRFESDNRELETKSKNWFSFST